MGKDNRGKNSKKEIRTIKDADKKRLTKILLKRYSLGKTSRKERKAVERIDSDLFDKKLTSVSKEMIDRAEERQRKMLAERLQIDFQTKPEPQRRSLRLPLTYGAIAAAVALLITLSLPLLKKTGITEETTTTDLLAQSEIEKQIVAEGKMKRITLADGSVVHLNLGTTLSLHKNKFNAYTREVWLDEGEAFFEVTKDKNRPFIVHTADGLSTQVLGTSFNIKAYQELGEQVVSVKTGRVQVSQESGKSVVLDPDNKASFNTEKQTLTAGITDGTAAADWRTGHITLEDADLKEVALRLKQYYNVDLENRNNAIKPDIQLGMSFTLSTPLQQIVGEMAQIYKVRYRISDQTVIFYQ